MAELNRASKIVGLIMNLNKTKIMWNQYTQERPITLENPNIEQVHEYNYLGQPVHSDDKQEHEILKRIKTGWRTMGKHSSIFRSKMPMCLKRKVFDHCVLPAMTYGCETWS